MTSRDGQQTTGLYYKWFLESSESFLHQTRHFVRSPLVLQVPSFVLNVGLWPRSRTATWLDNLKAMTMSVVMVTLPEDTVFHFPELIHKGFYKSSFSLSAAVSVRIHWTVQTGCLDVQIFFCPWSSAWKDLPGTLNQIWKQLFFLSDVSTRAGLLVIIIMFSVRLILFVWCFIRSELEITLVLFFSLQVLNEHQPLPRHLLWIRVVQMILRCWISCGVPQGSKLGPLLLSVTCSRSYLKLTLSLLLVLLRVLLFVQLVQCRLGDDDSQVWRAGDHPSCSR